jgi:pimeloyl-ACP methyl ester carboxylesterase
MDEAISTGIRSTAGVVTSAALVMVCVFAVFATLSMLFYKQFGVGLAAAVLLDATIVRGVLLPATMKLLGERNWYLPSWLQWLPHFDHGELELPDEPEPEPEAPKQPKGKRRPVGAARITGLIAVALFAIGLAYLRFAPDSEAVSVPNGAKAGQLSLHPCHYGTEQGSYAADCGTLVVPENRHDAKSRLIALPVTRIRAWGAHPGVPIFRLQGGPGITNMEFADASRFAEKHDVVLVGYRGVDGSAKLDCPEVTSSRAEAREFLTEKAYRADAAAYKACATRLREEGFDLAGYTLPQRVDDLEAARRALGYGQIDLLSESAGTRTALIYGWRYPTRIHRSVMIGANPPGHFLWDAKTTGEQLRRYAALCEQDSSCRSRTRDLAGSVRFAYADLPDRWWFLPIKQGNVETAAFMGLVNATTDGAGPLAAPWTIDTLLAAGDGDGSGAWLLSVMAQLVFPKAQVWGDVAAVGRSDAAHARGFFARHAGRGSVIGAPLNDFIWAGGRLLTAWPASPDEKRYTRMRDSNVETLVISGALDLATPPQNATRELLPHLPNGRQVVLRDFGHTDDFWNHQEAAGTRLINRFLESGRVDTSLYTRSSVDFTPVFEQGWVAEIVLGVMIGFAALALLSLLAMRRRVRRRGRFGRPASVLLRSVYTLVLGLGGWFAGVLVVLVAFPTVPLDDALLGVLSIGIPVGLGVYLAWANRDASAGARTVGLWTALASALAGAWFGFHAAGDLVAVVTTIVGAAVGANLTLLVLDIRRDRSAREPAAAPQPILTAA